MLERRGAVQRNHGRLKEWVHVNLMEISQARCKVGPLANTTVTTDQVTDGLGTPLPRRTSGYWCLES